MASDQDFSDTNPMERLRTWQREGDVCFATARDVDGLQRALDAYRNAEVLLNEVEVGAVERLLLYAAHGRVLLELANDGDVDLASAAATRLANALSLARQHSPASVVDIKLDLCRAEHVIAMRREPRVLRDNLDETYA